MSGTDLRTVTTEMSSTEICHKYNSMLQHHASINMYLIKNNKQIS